MTDPVCSGRFILRPFKPNIEKLKAKRYMLSLVKIAVFPVDADSHNKAIKALYDLDPVSSAKLLIQTVRESPDQEILVNFSLTTTGIIYRNALIALKSLGERISGVLLESMSDKRQLVRKIATSALRDVADIQTVPVLIDCLKNNTNEFARAEAVKLLGTIKGVKGDEVASALSMVIRDKNSNVRALTASALGKIGNDSTEVLSALNKALKDSELKVRQNASKALNKLQT